MIFLNILAVESSCDDTAAAIVRSGREIISFKVASQIEKHKIFGGVVPEVASRNHIEAISPLVKTVMAEAKMTFKDIDALAVTYAPGLVGSLLVGVNFVKGLSMATGLPIIPVHHIKGHIASLYLSNHDLEPPFLCLVASGGHSSIFEVLDYTKIRTVGKTRDDAAGEAFDKIGRRLGFDYPGGITLDKVAEDGCDSAFKLPTPLKSEKTYDFSFSGLKTAMINVINNLNQKNIPIPIEDISASFRKAVVENLVCNLMRAAENLGYKKIGICGGVSANSLLRRRLEEECDKRNIRFFKPKPNLCGDNAAMIGSQAYYDSLGGRKADFSLNAYASMSVENENYGEISKVSVSSNIEEFQKAINHNHA